MVRTAQHGTALLAAGGIVAMALASGAYHPRQWLLVAMLAVTGAAAVATVHRRCGLAGPALVAVSAGAGLAALAGLSVAWAWYSRHLAWEEANRLLMYVAAFAAAAVLARGGYRRTLLACWWGGALGLLSIGGLVALRGVEDTPLGALTDPNLDIAPSLAAGAGGMFGIGGRLDWPTGYSNASAAIFLAGLLLLCAAAAAAAGRARDAETTTGVACWSMTAGLSVTGATAASACFLLGQSRGGFVAAVVGVAVLVGAARARATVLVQLACVAGGLATQLAALTEPLVAIGPLREVVQGGEGDHALAAAAAESAVRAAGQAGLAAAVLAGATAAVACLVLAAAQQHMSATSSRRTGQLAVGMVLVAVAGVVVLGSGRVGGWVERQVAGCRAGTQASEGASTQARTRLAEVGSNRCDFWRVAARTGSERPLSGLGANNFQGAYFLLRDSAEQPRQAHSLPLDMWASLGIPGSILLGVWLLVPAGVAARRARAASAPSAPAVAGMAAVYAAWLVQASLDWLWNMPAVTLPVLVAAGSLAAAGTRPPEPRRIRPAGALVAGGVATVLILGSFLPQLRADRLHRDARGLQVRGGEPAAIAERAAGAAAADPFWAQPRILEARMEAAVGDIAAATAAAADAVEREPRNWSIRFQAACVLATVEAPEADIRDELAAAARLNPDLEAPLPATGIPPGC